MKNLIPLFFVLFLANLSFGQDPNAHFVYDVKTSNDYFHYDNTHYIDTTTNWNVDTVYKTIYVDSAEFAQGNAYIVFTLIQPTSPNPITQIIGMTSSYTTYNSTLLDTLNLYHDTLYLTPNNINLTDILLFDMHQDFNLPGTPFVNYTYYNELYLTIRDTSLNGGILGLKQNETQENQFNLYPNPASNMLNLSFYTDISNPICIFDMTGKMVKQINDIQEGQNEIKLDVSNWSKGIYIIKNPSDIKRFTVE